MKAVGVLVILVTIGACESEPDPFNVPPPPPTCADGASVVDKVCHCGGVATGAVCPGSADGSTACSATGRCETRLPLHPLVGAADSSVYWTEPLPMSSVQHLQTQLVRYDASTGAVTVLRKGGYGIEIDGSTLVLQGTYETIPQGTVLKEIVVCPGGDCVNYVPIAAGDLVSMVPSLIAASGGTAYIHNTLKSEIGTCAETGCYSPTAGRPVPTTIATGISNVTDAVADSTGLYVLAGTSLFAVPAGGTTTNLLALATGGVAVALGQDLFVATPRSILKCPRAAAPCTPNAFATGIAIGALHLDGSELYWTDGDQLLRCPVEGCASPELVASCHAPMVGNASALYCTTTDTVLQIPK